MHFTVMVFGDYIDDQLEPYSEHINVEPFFAPMSSYFIQAIEKEIAEGKHDDIIGGTVSADEDVAAEDLEESDFSDLSHVEQIQAVYHSKYADTLYYNADTDEFETIETYNPNGKWDWYVVGGRWSGYFKVKDGIDPADVDYAASEPSAFAGPNEDPDYADRLRKRAIDFEGMRQEAYDQAIRDHDRLRHEWETSIAEHGEPDISFLKLSPGEISREDLEKARKQLFTHPAFICLRDKLGPFPNLRLLHTDREEHAQRARDAVLVPYAFIDHSGEWIAKQEFVLGDGFHANDEYVESFWAEFNATSDDEFVAIVDCHS